jgi:hypothetical protein
MSHQHSHSGQKRTVRAPDNDDILMAYTLLISGKASRKAVNGHRIHDEASKLLNFNFCELAATRSVARLRFLC